MKLKDIGQKLNVSVERARQLLAQGRLIINEEDGTVERIPYAQPEQGERARIRSGIVRANIGMTPQNASHYEKSGAYDPETFIVKKNKRGAKPKSDVQKVMKVNNVSRLTADKWIKEGHVDADFKKVKKAPDLLPPTFNPIIKVGYTTFQDVENFTEKQFKRIKGVGGRRAFLMKKELDAWKEKREIP